VLVYETLRDDILWLRIAPGNVVDEVALAVRFKVSRTPIREALLLLQGDGLVQFLPNRTSIVAPLSLDNAGDYFDTLLILSRSMARAVARSGRAEEAALTPYLDAFFEAVETQDHTDALRHSLALQRSLSALTENMFLERYLGHALDSGMRSMILHYYPNASRTELRQAGQLLEALVETVVSGNEDSSDQAISAIIMQQVEIILRSLQPSDGEQMEIRPLELSA